MSEPKLHTTREERDRIIETFDFVGTVLGGENLSNGRLVSVMRDVNALEDELARVREELACEKILREGAEGRALMILESKNTINDRLREENRRLNDAVDSLCRARQSEKQEQDKQREELESARRVISAAEDATWACAALGYGEKSKEYIEALRHVCREYRARFGGKNDRA
jgi:hypothetical protein